MGFWEGEKCEYCNGSIVEKHVDVPRKVGGKYVLLENVPVGVCRKCGTRRGGAVKVARCESVGHDDSTT